MRGGSWNNNPNNVRVANRNRNNPWKRNTNNGFRAVRTPQEYFGLPNSDSGMISVESPVHCGGSESDRGVHSTCEPAPVPT